MIKLQEVKDREGFFSFYKENNLSSYEDKINFLQKEVGIICDTNPDFSLEEELSTLEQYVLYSWDKISSN